MTGLTAFVSLVLLAIAGNSPAETPPPATTQICIVFTSQVQAGLFDAQALEHEVERIWKPYGVELDGLYRPCISPYSNASRDASAARTPMPRPATTIIVKLRGDAGALPINTLGSIDFVGDTPRPVISLWLNEAARMLGRDARELTPFNADPRFRLQLARLLGRALAHELGHYLLGSRAHSAAGLMRASYKDFDATSTNTALFALEPMELSALQGRLASWREPAARVGTNVQSAYETVPSGAEALPETTSPIMVTDVSPAAASVRRIVSTSP